MKKAIVIVALLLLAAPVSAACYPPIQPSCEVFTGNPARLNAEATIQQNACKAEHAQYNTLTEIYNDCTAEAVLDQEDAKCQAELENRGGNGSATYDTQRGKKYEDSERLCKVACDKDFYLTISGSCKPVNVPTTEPRPAVIPVPVATQESEQTVLPAVEPTPILNQVDQVFNRLIGKETEPEPASEAPEPVVVETAPTPEIKRSWWHWLNPFNWL